MKVVDLIKTPMEALWADCMTAIAASEDPLKENYTTINFEEFISFPCVVDSDRIVCFSGLQYNERKWGRGIARASSRMWIDPAYRQPGITKFTGGSKFLNTTYCLPLQFAELAANNIDSVFISRESNVRAFKEYLKLIKINCNMDFELEPTLYNVCGPQVIVPLGCQQFVAVHHRTATTAAWTANMIKYKLNEFTI